MTSNLTEFYDPNQDPEEKRSVRKSYRNLAKSVEERQSNPSEYTAQDLANHVERANDLFNKVKNPQEATLDSHFLVMASNIGAQKARAMKSGTGAFDIDDFITKLVRYMGGQSNLDENEGSDYEDDGQAGQNLDWAKVARQALAKSRRVPTTTFMLGPLSIEQKKRATTKRARQEKNKEDLRKPQELKEEDIVRSENETTKNVQQLETLLTRLEGRINIFRFIVNPNDFAQSVENLFYLSFLIRDGKVAFELDEDTDEPVIYLCEQPADEDYVQGLKKQQKVFEFDMSVWRRAIEVFNITESIIPQRPPARTKLGDKWY